ncbi:CFI-box-CTERM domain-containing protein [Leifsonia xyli]|uniref:CFI-box-CTERM domain-containing protein n=1 Tax=Leifsonia xyli TaxID=1575 RepID=UPI003D67D5D9
MKRTEAEQNSNVSLAEIYEWERKSAAISDEMRVHIRRYGLPDPELGEAVGDASLRMGVLVALLRRAPGGAVTRTELLDRIEDLKELYRKCERYARHANSVNRQLTIDYSQRINQLDIFEQKIDTFFSNDTNPFTQGATKKGGCYIATAVYGSYDHPSVLVLRRFRDDRLEKTVWGRAFIRGYYAVSPGLARHFSSVNWLNRRTRGVLDRFVAHLEE